MFGGDSHPTVMTTRFEFGGVSDAHVRGLCTMQREIRPMCAIVWLVLERSTNTMERSKERQLRADASFKKTMPMQCA